jgi:serine O-acetyltransferase
LQFIIHPSHAALWLFRIAAQGPRLLSIIGRQFLFVTYGCDVQHGATLSPGILLPHPIGIVIGGGCRVESDVTLYQHITLGAGHDGFPWVKRGATLFPGCVVAGGIVVGPRAKVGALAFVSTDVPADLTVRGGTRF